MRHVVNDGIPRSVAVIACAVVGVVEFGFLGPIVQRFPRLLAVCLDVGVSIFAAGNWFDREIVGIKKTVCFFMVRWATVEVDNQA